MALFLLKIIVSALSFLSNIIYRLTFPITAYLLVIIIQGREALQGVLEEVGNFVKACLEYVLELVLEMASTIVSSSFDLIKGAVLGSVVGTGGAIVGLADKMKMSVYELMEGVPEVVEGAMKMVYTMATDLWNNYMDA